MCLGDYRDWERNVRLLVGEFFCAQDFLMLHYNLDLIANGEQLARHIWAKAVRKWLLFKCYFVVDFRGLQFFRHVDNEFFIFYVSFYAIGVEFFDVGKIILDEQYVLGLFFKDLDGPLQLDNVLFYAKLASTIIKFGFYHDLLLWHEQVLIDDAAYFAHALTFQHFCKFNIFINILI